MNDAERKKLEAELEGNKKLLVDHEAKLAATPYGGPNYQETRENWKGRIKRVKTTIKRIEEKLGVK